MAELVSITYTPRDVERRPADRYARVPLGRATLVEGKGIAGDLKGGGRTRQLNVMRAETLAELAAEGRKTEPGEMGEQLVIAGLDPLIAQALPNDLGQRVVEHGTHLTHGQRQTPFSQ